jgi:hypothetical protein
MILFRKTTWLAISFFLVLNACGEPGQTVDGKSSRCVIEETTLDNCTL